MPDVSSLNPVIHEEDVVRVNRSRSTPMMQKKKENHMLTTLSTLAHIERG